MAKERMYGWNGELPAKEPSGQKAIVLREMRKDGGMHGGHDWAEIIGPELRTRQDPYRVVLYYILILKNEGVVKTNEFDINAVTREVEQLTKHGITVKTNSEVKERELPAEPVSNVDAGLAAVQSLLAESN